MRTFVSGAVLATLVAAGTAHASKPESGALRLEQSPNKVWTLTTTSQGQQYGSQQQFGTGQQYGTQQQNQQQFGTQQQQQYGMEAESEQQKSGVGEEQRYEQPSMGTEERAGFSEPAVAIHDRIHFEVGSATLDDDSKKALDEVASLLEAHPQASPLKIEGFADSTGSSELNDKLSSDRADAVKSYLMEKGISADRLKTDSLGEAQPAGSNESANGRAMNRRAELSLGE